MAFNTSLTGVCNGQGFALPPMLGVEILSLTAFPVSNFSMSSVVTHDWTKSEFSGLDFCNVTVEYTHTGQDRITVQVCFLTSPDGMEDSRPLEVVDGPLYKAWAL